MENHNLTVYFLTLLWCVIVTFSSLFWFRLAASVIWFIYATLIILAGSWF